MKSAESQGREVLLIDALRSLIARYEREMQRVEGEPAGQQVRPRGEWSEVISARVVLTRVVLARAIGGGE